MFFYTLFFFFVNLAAKRHIPFNGRTLQWTRAFWVGLAVWLLMGLRDQTVAGDTVMYVWVFQSQPIEWTGFKVFFLEQREPLFYLLEMLCQKITTNYTFYLFATSLMLAAGFSTLLCKYSKDMFLSVLIFCAVGSMYFCMAGLRQTIAMGCTMFAFYYAKERKLWLFLIWCFIAFWFHNSAIVFAVVYLLVNHKVNWFTWIITSVFVYLGLTRDPIVMETANYFTTKEYVMDEHGLNHTMFFIQLVFVVFCFVYGYNYKNTVDQKDFNSFLLLSFVGLCVQALTPIKGEFFRVSSYFSVFLCFSVPQTLSWIKDEKEKNMINLAIVWGILGYLYIFGNARSYMTCF